MDRLDSAGLLGAKGLAVLLASLSTVAFSSPLTVTPEQLDAGSVPPGGSAIRSLTLENTGLGSVAFEFPGFAEQFNQSADLVVDLETESFGPIQFRPVSDGPLSGSWTGFSGNLELLAASGSTWTDDLTILLTSTPDLDFSTVIYQVGGNSNYLAPENQIFHWSGGVGNTPIDETFEFSEPIVVSGLYPWVGNAWSAGGGTWNGLVTLAGLAGLGGQTGLITAIDPPTGELAAGESVTVEALFESGSRTPGIYEEALILATDQPEQPELAIPVRLTVPGQAMLVPPPSALDFGEVVVGSTNSQTLSLENTGNLALVLEQIAVSDARFSVSVDVLEITPASSASLTVSYAPDAPGADAAELSFTSNDPTAPQVTVALTGMGLPAPGISIEPASIALHLPADGLGSASFEIVNTGKAPLNFTLPAFADDDTPTVRMTRPSVRSSTPPADLRARLSATQDEQAVSADWQRSPAPATRSESGYQIEFSNFSAAGGSFELIDGPLSGELSFVIADFVLNSASGQTFANDLTLLIASTPTPDLQNGDDVLVQLGGSLTQLAPIVAGWGTGNSGAPGTVVQSALQANEPIVLDEVYLLLGNNWIEGSGEWSGVIEIIDLAPTSGPITDASPTFGTVAPGEAISIALEVSAAGLVQGDYIGRLQVASNDPVRPLELFELSLAVAGTPALDLSTSALDFGELFIGQQRSEDLLISNTGSAPLTASDFAIDTPGFDVDSDALTIAPGASVSLPVTFTATTTGTASATLSFSSDDPDNPNLSVALTASILEAPALVVDPANIEAALAAGETIELRIALNNPGSGPLDFEFPDFVDGRSIHHAQRTILAIDELMDEPVERAQEPDAGPTPAPRSTQPASFEIALEAFEAFGGEFVPMATNLNGNLSRIDADFVLDQASGLTWANDLALVITQGPELTPDSILLQAGGTITLSSNAIRLNWGMGSSSVPDTAVQTSLTLDSALSLSEAYAWVGNAWVAQDGGQWSGLIGLDGVVDGTSFIVAVEPPVGQVAGGDTIMVDLTLSAAELVAGTYRDRLRLVSNDPVNPDFDILATLTVSGQPELVMAPGALDFGDVFTGAAASSTLLLFNPGTDLLLIDDITVSGDGFATNVDSLSIPPGSSIALTVNFFTETAGSFGGELILSSNSPDPLTTVALSALARNPGILAVSETSLTIEVPAGATAQSSMTLGNVGESVLVFDALAWQAGNPNPEQTTVDHPALLTAPHGPVVTLAPASAGPAPGLLEDREVLWQQSANGSFRITSSRSTELDAGLYAADNFLVSGAALVQGITAYGFRFDGAERFDETFESVVFYLYEDVEGQPAGSPDDGEDAHIFRFEAAMGTPGFSIHEEPQGFGTRADVALDLEAASGEGLLLPDGRYWLVVHAVSASPDLYDDVWSLISSFDGAQTALYIDADNIFNIGAETWQPLAGVIPAHSSNLAFRIEGRALSFLSLAPAQGIIEVDQTRELELLFDASDYLPGSYEALLVIRTDSPATPELTVPVTMVVTEGEAGLDWVNLAGPAEAEIPAGQTFAIHGSARVSFNRTGELDQTRMWVGFHDRDTHPALWPASAWVAGTLQAVNLDHANFIAEAGSHLPPGEYRYATRFQLSDGSYVYGGYHEAGGGFWNGLLHVSGRLNVLPSLQDRVFIDRFAAPD
ncbi:MAG: choice-of-anchor D domain-containing protein [Wenzhouxiangella sp.]|nr:MAG: choice-of-anchor D domain-containing protein [Wenzhouxiangella sp.]